MRVSNNENCLKNMRCPKCGQDSRFLVMITACASVTDDGTDIEPDSVNWNSKASTICSDDECDMMGEWNDFYKEED